MSADVENSSDPRNANEAPDRHLYTGPHGECEAIGEHWHAPSPAAPELPDDELEAVAQAALTAVRAGGSVSEAAEAMLPELRLLAARIRAEAVADERQRIAQAAVELATLTDQAVVRGGYREGEGERVEVLWQQLGVVLPAGSVPVATRPVLDFPAMAAEALEGIVAAYRAAGKDTESEAFRMHLAAKVAEEGGEVLAAYLHATGWARRGGTWEEFDAELADTVISAFLAAVANGRDLLAAVEAKHKIVMSRGFKEPGPVATPTEPRGQADRMGGSIYDPDDEGPECGWLKEPDDTRYGCQLPGGHSGKCEAASPVPTEPPPRRKLAGWFDVTEPGEQLQVPVEQPEPDLLGLLEMHCGHGQDYDDCPHDCEPPRAPPEQPDGWGEGVEVADHPEDCQCPPCVIDRLRDSNDTLRDQLGQAAEEIDRLRAELGWPAAEQPEER